MLIPVRNFALIQSSIDLIIEADTELFIYKVLREERGITFCSVLAGYSQGDIISNMEVRSYLLSRDR